MPCYHPLLAYRSKEGKNENGKWPLVFNPRDGFTDMEQYVPCGQCIGCRLERSRQWAVRCVHEAKMHDENCFITLTFSDKYLNPSQTLVKADFQKFMKRLRSNTGRKIRYFHCGEYGDKYRRPHHHACLFGWDFSDKSLWKIQNGERLYHSKLLGELWPFGLHAIGDVTFRSAAYVARYITKKITGEKAAEHYGGRLPEYTTMSRRPGIGAGWLEKYKDDVFPLDEVITRGKSCKPPRYYDKRYELLQPEIMAAVKAARAKKGDHKPDQFRLEQKEKVKKSAIARLRRPYESQAV